MSSGVLFPAFPDWQQAYESFLESVFSYSGSRASFENYRSVLRLFFSDGRDPAGVTRQDVELFLLRKSSSRRNRGADLSASTKGFSIVVVQSFYRYCSEFQVGSAPLYTKQLPTAGMKPPKRSLRPRNMPPDVFTRLIESIPLETARDARDVALLLLAFWTSRRKGEIAGLLYGDFQTATVLEHGQARQAVMFSYAPKGNKRSRVLQECPPEAWAAIQYYLEKSGRKETIRPEHPLFATRYGGQMRALSKSSMTVIFKQRMRKAGIDPKLYAFHALRHSALTERYRAGQDLISLQSISGHKSLDVLMRYLLSMQGTVDTGAALLSKQFAHLTPH